MSNPSNQSEDKPPIPTRAALRIELRKVLLTDSDINAFCIDHFPEVFSLFSDGMNRMQKFNLLLEIGNEALIADKLSLYKFQQNNSLSAHRGNRARLVKFAGGGMGMIMLLIFVILINDSFRYYSLEIRSNSDCLMIQLEGTNETVLGSLEADRLSRTKISKKATALLFKNIHQTILINIDSEFSKTIPLSIHFENINLERLKPEQ